ncbi:MAG: hypothetical protein IT424_13725 [Pirellulales bacterium]|nr:hypothetical protein [Pirellulales bacterium]
MFAAAACSAAFFTTSFASAQVPAGAGEAAAAQPDNDAPQVLDQGPIHEAFAEPVPLDPADGVVVPKEPPEPINELPPEVRPEGDNVEWIPGYWMWSDQQQDFIWVSGVWREIPPGRRWVPGHWTTGEAGYTWTPGFWVDAQAAQVDLLPLPPDSLEVGPSSPAPGDNYFWIPGCWRYQNSAYAWRTGYWYPGQANWLWVPDHYSYTPYGATFVGGYWDYLLASRGLLYAPVWWSRPIYARPGYYYRPFSVLNTSLLLTALFINGHHHHYYYGYGGWGSNFYRPWWSYGYGGRGNVYDPFFAYHRWHDGHNHGDWVNRVRQDFNRQQQNFVQQRSRITGQGIAHVASRDQLVRNISEVRRDNNLPLQLRTASAVEQQVAKQRTQDFHQLQAARRNALADAVRNGQLKLNDQQAQGAGLGRAAVARSGDLPHSRGAGRADQLANSAARPDARTAFRLPPLERSENADARVNGGRATVKRDVQPQINASSDVVVPGALGHADQFDRTDLQPSRRGTFDGPQLGEQSRRRLETPNSGGANARTRLQPGVPEGRPLKSATPGSGGDSSVAGRTDAPRPQFRPAVRPPSDAASEGAAVMRGYRGAIGERQATPLDGAAQPQRSIRIPSAGAESRRMHIPSDARRNIQVPRGESRSFRIPSGGGPQNFQAPQSGGRSFNNVPRGGGGGNQPNLRTFQGGGSRPAMRGSFNGGGNAGHGGGNRHRN